MALERFDGFVNTQLTDVDTLVSAAGGKAGVGLPVNIQCRSRVERKLLSTLPGRCVPDYCCLRASNRNSSVRFDED